MTILAAPLTFYSVQNASYERIAYNNSAQTQSLGALPEIEFFRSGDRITLAERALRRQTLRCRCISQNFGDRGTEATRYAGSLQAAAGTMTRKAR
jgi:hypothetical protein